MVNGPGDCQGKRSQREPEEFDNNRDRLHPRRAGGNDADVKTGPPSEIGHAAARDAARGEPPWSLPYASHTSPVATDTAPRGAARCQRGVCKDYASGQRPR